jgi:Flp pilus assembly protein TadG
VIETFKERLRALDRDSESGQAMVEFVLVFPVQLFLTVGIIQFAFIAHAYLVVGQAAFMGARAAAVADMSTGITPGRAAERQVARTVALLTTGNPNTTVGEAGAVNPPAGEMQWSAQAASGTGTTGTFGFNDNRAQEAYGLLARSRAPFAQEERQGEYWSCEVVFNYMVLVPIVMPVGSGPTINGRRTFRIQRVGYIATPWKMAPIN